ncbi:ComEC/Rec2 family competence protein [Wenyingzhuangia sp. IMCC45574]
MRVIYTYIPFQVLIGVLLGILFPPTTTSYFSILGSLLLVLFLVLMLLHVKKKYPFNTKFFFVLLLLFGVLSSWLSQHINNQLNCSKHYQFRVKDNHVLQLLLLEKLKTTQKYQRFYAEVISVDHQKTCGKVLVQVAKKTGNNIEIGEVLLCRNKITPVDLPPSTYHFDYRTYLERRNIYGKVSVHHYIKKGAQLNLFIGIQRLRNSIVTKLNATILSTQTKGLLMAMLLGDRDGISADTQKAFVDAGVVHLIAISGMHIGVLYFLLLCTFGFLKRFKYGKYFQVVCILVCLWGFAVFSGLSSSVVRCVTMFSFIVLSKLIQRKALLLEPIISSALLLLWIKPNFLYDAGFQLSYTAVISIVVFYPLITRNYKFSNKIGQYFFDVLLVSIIAQLGVLPLSLYYFHQFPFQFLVANFFAVSLLPFVLYGGLIVLLKVLCINSYHFIELLFDKGIVFYLEIIQKISLLDAFIVRDVFFHESYVVGYYLVVLCLWKLFDGFKFRNLAYLLMAVLFFQSSILFQNYRLNHHKELVVENDFFTPCVNYLNGMSLHLMAKDSLTTNDLLGVKSICTDNNITSVTNYSNDVFQFRGDYYVIVSKKLQYEMLSKEGLILILRDNPRINLERLVKDLKPQKIIVEAKNYKANVLKWKSTCKKLQVPFYNVSTNGAYVIKVDF